VNREEAQKALELLRVTNGAAFSTTQIFLWRGVEARWPFIALWSATLAVNIGLIFLLKARRAGAKTFIENQIWSIWLTFILGVMGTAIVNDLLGLKLLALGPIIAILSAFGFSMMGAVMGRRWYLGTIIFGGSSLLMAAFPHWQYLILGVVWCVAQLVGGVWLEVDKRKRGKMPHLV
jgi:serine/threonine-protein kinase